MEYHSAIKKNILPFVTTWMDLEGIMQREISQTWIRQIPYYFTYMWNLKNKTNEQKKQKHTLKYRELVDARGEEAGRVGTRD